MQEKIEPHLPIYCRPPNKLVKYEERYFNDKHGHGGIVRVAIFLDKNKKEQEMDAQVMWNALVWNMDTGRFVEVKSWMRYCPSYWTQGKTDEYWDNLREAEGKQRLGRKDVGNS